MNTPDRDDPERDAWLRAALAHAPNADIAAPPALSAAILRDAARPQAARAPALWRRWLDAWSWLARPPVAAGFASVTVATVVGVMWWGRPIDEAMPRAPVPMRAEAPAAAASAEHAQVATTAEASRARLVLNAPPVQAPAAAANADAGSENAAAPAMTLRKAAPKSSMVDEAKPSIAPPDLASRAPAPAPTPAPAAAAPATANWHGTETASIAATETAKAGENARRRTADGATAMRERRSEPRLEEETELSVAGRALTAAPAAPVADAAAREAPAAPATSAARAMSRGAAQPAAQDAAAGRAEDALRAAVSPPATLLARWSAAAADWRWQAPGAIAPEPAGADARAWLSRLERATRGRWGAAPAPASQGTVARWWQGDMAMGSVQFEAEGLRWLGPDGGAKFAPLDAATLAALRSF